MIQNCVSFPVFFTGIGIGTAIGFLAAMIVGIIAFPTVKKNDKDEE